MKGAKPVSKVLEKHYSDIDIEAEILREKQRANVLAAEAAKKRLFLEKLMFSGLIILLCEAVLLLASRIFRALHLLEHPEGKHWTLK